MVGMDMKARIFSQKELQCLPIEMCSSASLLKTGK